VRKIIRWSLLVVIGLGLIGGGYGYYEYSKYHPNTDDAYLDAHVVRPAPLVSGRVAQVLVHNHEQVRNGQLLFRIDPTPFRIAVARARAQLTQAQRDVHAEVAEVRADQASVAYAHAIYVNDLLKARRARNLLSEGYATEQVDDDAIAALRSARARLHLAESQLEAARRKLGQPGPHNQLIEIAQANLNNALWRLKQTHVDSTCDGDTAKVKLRTGNMALAGQAPFVIVCAHFWWVNANFKETDLSRIRVGDPARIHVDMYPGHRFRGKVISISPAAGTAFSLLPPENATGNWVKVTQRVPVRVVVLDASPAYPLRVGASASVTIKVADHGPPPTKAHVAH
jgi:membrane fusion protein (multidrug efflux system)